MPKQAIDYVCEFCGKRFQGDDAKTDAERHERICDKNPNKDEGLECISKLVEYAENYFIGFNVSARSLRSPWGVFDKALESSKMRGEIDEAKAKLRSVGLI